MLSKNNNISLNIICDVKLSVLISIEFSSIQGYRTLKVHITLHSHLNR